MEKAAVEIEGLKQVLHAKEVKRKSDLLKGAVVALFLSTGSLLALFFQIDILFGNITKRPDAAPIDVSDLHLQIQAIDARLTRVNDLVKAMSKPNSEASTSIEQANLANQMATLDDRLKSIESAILDSPERALSIPLLRKDIAETAKRVEEYRASGRSDTDRLYEQQKWILGGVGTVLLAVIGGAVTIIFRSLPKGKTDDP